MSNIKLKNHNWHTRGIYDTGQNKTQETINSDVQTSLGLKAPIASPTFTGTPKAPTAAAGTNTTQIATTAFVKTAIDATGVGSATAGFHNSIYRGKNLGTSVTAAQYAQIGAGTFDDLFIGDYWVINSVNWRIAAFDYWLNCGDTSCTTHHVVIVPDTYLYTAQMHNTDTGGYIAGADNNPTTGAYVGSDMYKTNLESAKTRINTAFGSAHILTHRNYLKNAVTNGYESAGAWYDSTVELMTEQNVYGCKVFGNCLNGTNFPASYTIDKTQFPLFALEPSRICIRAHWWLRDVAASTDFATVAGAGAANANSSSYPIVVRPAFGIRA